MKGALAEQQQRALNSFFAEHKEVLFAYLFGSYASGKRNKLSDIDIALYIDESAVAEKEYRYGYKAHILSELMLVLHKNEVDLVILNEAPPLLMHRAIYRGKLLFSRNDKVRNEFAVKSFNKYVDYKLIMREHHK